MLATGGYDHTIKIFNAFSSSPKTTLQHNDSQVNALAFNNGNSMLAAAGFQSIKIYDYNTSNNPVINFDQVNKWVDDEDENLRCSIDFCTHFQIF